MITVEQAEQLIHQHSLTMQEEVVSLAEAKGRILAESLVADRDFPPFNRVTMDGIAIRLEHEATSANQFEIVGIQAAGSTPLTLENANQAIEVMTGAVLPNGADTVIPYESITINGETNKTAVLNNPIEMGRNIHRQGSDRTAGATIVQAGAKIDAAEIGVAATVGKSSLKVIKPPSIAIISTGDELVAIDQTPLPHQIRSSNAATMNAALQEWRIAPGIFHILDDLKGTTDKLRELIESNDILLISGGVSKGKFDYVPQALHDLKVAQQFHRIRQRPGKPFWFGSHARGTLVFAFPGNPVSSLMCFNRYLKPWLNKQFGIANTAVHAYLSHRINFTPDLTYFAQVKLQQENGKLVAHPVEGHGSGDLANLVDADGFMELPRGNNSFEAGELHPVYPYRDLRP